MLANGASVRLDPDLVLFKPVFTRDLTFILVLNLA